MRSLKNWIVDFWERRFKKKYEVEAEGESSAKHDFRICGQCGKRVGFIDVEVKNFRCEKCSRVGYNRRAILCSYGVYKDHKRKFVLKKNLYSTWTCCWMLFGIALIFVYFLLYDVSWDILAWGEEGAVLHDHSWLNILFRWVVAFFVFGLWSSYQEFFASGEKQWLEKVGFLGVGVFLMLFSMMVLYANGDLRWVDYPSKEEWIEIQHEKRMDAFHLISSEEDKYLESKKNLKELGKQEWRRKSSMAYLKMAQEDLEKTMVAYHKEAPNLLALYREELFLSYLQYLKNLRIEDTDKLKAQCSVDPWNMISAARVAAWPEILKICK